MREIENKEKKRFVVTISVDYAHTRTLLQEGLYGVLLLLFSVSRINNKKHSNELNRISKKKKKKKGAGERR